MFLKLGVPNDPAFPPPVRAAPRRLSNDGDDANHNVAARNTDNGSNPKLFKVLVDAGASDAEIETTGSLC